MYLQIVNGKVTGAASYPMCDEKTGKYNDTWIEVADDDPRFLLFKYRKDVNKLLQLGFTDAAQSAQKEENTKELKNVEIDKAIMRLREVEVNESNAITVIRDIIRILV